MRWMHRVRLYPTPTQVSRLVLRLDVSRKLYNALLEGRREPYRRRGVTVTTKVQSKEITDLRKSDALVAAVYRECEDAVLHRLDLAMSAFFRRLARGEKAGYPRYKARSRLLEQHQRALEAATVRDKAGRCTNAKDPKRIAARRRVARAHERVANCRLDALHKVAKRRIGSADRIVIEDLRLSSMTRSAKGTVDAPGRNVAAKSGLNRAMLDAGFGILARLIREKAGNAVREVIAVDARYSSQTCGRCLHVSAKSRRRRRFCCVVCGWSVHADVAAALEIRRQAELPRTSTLMWGRTPLMQHDAQ